MASLSNSVVGSHLEPTLLVSVVGEEVLVQECDRICQMMSIDPVLAFRARAGSDSLFRHSFKSNQLSE